MKKILILLLFVGASSPKGYAQKDQSKPINTGYVFIDGEFIEPPYVIKKKKNELTINGYPIKIKDTNGDLKYPKNFPQYPPNLRETDSISSLINYKFPDSKKALFGIAVPFFYTKYPVEKAEEEIIKFFANAPNISKYENGILYAKNGDQRHIMLTSNIYRKRFSQSEDRKMIDNKINRIKNELILGDLLVFESQNIKTYLTIKKTKITDLVNLINYIDSVSLPQNQIDSILLKKNFFPGSKRLYLINNVKFRDAINEILKVKDSNLKKAYNPVRTNKYIRVFCPVAYDLDDYMTEVNVLIEQLNEYGYTQATTYLDQTNNQNADITLNP